jgi:hypothetical protein
MLELILRLSGLLCFLLFLNHLISIFGFSFFFFWVRICSHWWLLSMRLSTTRFCLNWHLPLRNVFGRGVYVLILRSSHGIHIGYTCCFLMTSIKCFSLYSTLSHDLHGLSTRSYTLIPGIIISSLIQFRA